MGKFADMKFKDSYVYMTSSYSMMSDLCQLLLKVGSSASIRLPKVTEPTKHRNGMYLTTHPCWHISRKYSKIAMIKTMKRSDIEYNDFVYGIELEKNHTLFVEQYGKMCLTGNCRCTSVHIPSGFTIDNDGNLVVLKPGQTPIIERSAAASRE
jgi:hypothetical protein